MRGVNRIYVSKKRENQELFPFWSENQCCLFSRSKSPLAPIGSMNFICVPWAHMAAPTLLDTEKINPTKGSVSKSAAVKPNTDESSTSADPNVTRTNITDTHVDSPIC